MNPEPNNGPDAIASAEKNIVELVRRGLTVGAPAGGFLGALNRALTRLESAEQAAGIQTGAVVIPFGAEPLRQRMRADEARGARRQGRSHRSQQRRRQSA